MHVCGRCPPERPFPGKPFQTFEEMRLHMIRVHGKEPEERSVPDAIDLRYVL